MSCAAEGTLERVDRIPQFTHFELNAKLRIGDPYDQGKAERGLEKAERARLITRSLKAETTLHPQVEATDSA